MMFELVIFLTIFIIVVSYLSAFIIDRIWYSMGYTTSPNQLLHTVAASLMIVLTAIALSIFINT